MTVYRPGCSGDRYIDRVSDQLRCVCELRGDRNTSVDGIGPYCIIFDRESIKIDIDDVGVNSSTIEAIWLKSDCIDVGRGSVFLSGDFSGKAKSTPTDNFDGWMSVQLQLSCKC